MSSQQEVSIHQAVRISGAVVKYSLTQLGSNVCVADFFWQGVEMQTHRKSCDFFGDLFDTKIMVSMFVFICYLTGWLPYIPLKIGDFEIKTS